MKAPRHFLLQRHQTHASELDALRKRLVHQLASPKERWWTLVWREVFCAARPAWIGLAALALVAITLHLASTGSPPSHLATSPVSTQERNAAREERSQLWAELRDPVPNTSDPNANVPPAKPSRPPQRSELPLQLWPA